MRVTGVRTLGSLSLLKHAPSPADSGTGIKDGSLFCAEEPPAFGRRGLELEEMNFVDCAAEENGSKALPRGEGCPKRISCPKRMGWRNFAAVTGTERGVVERALLRSMPALWLSSCGEMVRSVKLS